MKYPRLTQLLLLVACAIPLLANATAVNISRANDYSYSKGIDPRKGRKLNKISAPLCCANNNSGIGHGLNFLSTTTNLNLTQGTYQFGQFESAFNPTFTDKWTFSLAGNSQVNFTLSNQDPSGVFSNLLDIANLKLELFDKDNQSLGAITKNSSLNLLLAANDQYSFLVSGSARGKLGGAYFGKMDVAPVPIGDSLPMFTAALLMLGLRLRNRFRPA